MQRLGIDGRGNVQRAGEQVAVTEGGVEAPGRNRRVTAGEEMRRNGRRE